jgi:hypothetical protein
MPMRLSLRNFGRRPIHSEDLRPIQTNCQGIGRKRMERLAARAISRKICFKSQGRSWAALRGSPWASLFSRQRDTIAPRSSACSKYWFWAPPTRVGTMEEERTCSTRRPKTPPEHLCLSVCGLGFDQEFGAAIERTTPGESAEAGNKDQGFDVGLACRLEQFFGASHIDLHNVVPFSRGEIIGAMHEGLNVLQGLRVDVLSQAEADPLGRLRAPDPIDDPPALSLEENFDL